MNSQPLRIVLVRSAEARARLVEHMAEGNQAKTAAAPLVAILAADNEFHEELPSDVPALPAAPRTCSPASARSASSPPR